MARAERCRLAGRNNHYGCTTRSQVATMSPGCLQIRPESLSLRADCQPRRDFPVSLPLVTVAEIWIMRSPTPPCSVSVSDSDSDVKPGADSDHTLTSRWAASLEGFAVFLQLEVAFLMTRNAASSMTLLALNVFLIFLPPTLPSLDPLFPSSLAPWLPLSSQPLFLLPPL